MSGGAPGAALAVEGLSLRFGGVVAVDDLSFSVEPGEFVGLIGPNGAGKSSLFNCLSGAYEPTSGRILLDGREITRLRPYRRAALGVARTFQSLALYPELSVIDNLLLGAQVKVNGSLLRAGIRGPGIRREERRIRARAIEIAERIGVATYLTGSVNDMPYGVQKRLDLARILLAEPRLLLLDEPLVGMTQAEKSELVTLIRSLHDEVRPTIIVVEHDVSVVMEVTSRVLVMNFGSMLAHGSAREIQQNPDVIEAYLGKRPVETYGGAR